VGDECLRDQLAVAAVRCEAARDCSTAAVELLVLKSDSCYADLMHDTANTNCFVYLAPPHRPAPLKIS
jgi:hypothetical protein